MKSVFAKLRSLWASSPLPGVATEVPRQRLPLFNAELALLVPSLSAQPCLVTQIVDRKNADEWAMALAVLACAGIAYVGYLHRRNRAAMSRGIDGPQDVSQTIAGLRRALRTRWSAWIMVPLAASSPLAIGSVVQCNVEEWLCFFGLLACAELYRAAQILKQSNREIERQLQRLSLEVENANPVGRYELRERLGRRLYGRLEQFELSNSAPAAG